MVGATSPEPALAAGALLERLGGAPARDVWVSSGPLDGARERTLALAALEGGWAILREPAVRLPAATLLWARPTLLAGAADELEALMAAAAAEAPRWGARRWLRRRLSRLRAVIVEGEAGPVAGRLAELDIGARVLPFHAGGW